MPVTRTHDNKAKQRRSGAKKTERKTDSSSDNNSRSKTRQSTASQITTTQEVSNLAQQTSDNRVHIPNEQETLLSRKQTESRPSTLSAILSERGDKDTTTNPQIGKESQEQQVAKEKTTRKNLLPTPTSGLTATQVNDDDEDDAADASTPTSGKRCCKSDLKRCLRVGDWIENIRIPQHILKARNDGKKLLAQFDGQNFIDYQTEKKYRSISDWIKQRMIDLNAISETSNISGWDYAVVHREGRTTTLRLLVEETKQKMEMMRNTMKEQRQSNSPLTPLSFTPSFTTSSSITGNSPLVSSSFGNSLMNSSPFYSSSPLPNDYKFVQQQQQKVVTTPSFGLGSLTTTNNVGNTSTTVPNDVLLHSRLQNARQQVAELEQLLYVGRNN